MQTDSFLCNIKSNGFNSIEFSFIPEGQVVVQQKTKVQKCNIQPQ